MMIPRPVAFTLSRRRLSLAIIASAFAVAEFALRVSGYRMSGQTVLPDATPKGVQAAFQSSQSPDGVCGTTPSRRRDPEAKLLLFLGDSSSCGPAQSTHWTVQLQALLDLNAGEGPRHQIVDSGLWGSTSFQGMRRLDAILEGRPDIVFFAFGAGDAQEVRLSDAASAERLRGLDWLALSRVATLVGEAFGLLRPLAGLGTELVRRVSVDEYGEHARDFAARARRAHVVPVLMVPDDEDEAVAAYAARLREVAATDGVLAIDRARRASQPDLPTPDARGRAFRTAVSVLELLRTLGLVATDRIFDHVVEPGQMEDFRAELGSGLWSRETWRGGQTGRWTAEVASLAMERRANEGGLVLEASFLHPGNDTRLRVDIGGVTVGILAGPNGFVHRTLDIRSLAGRHLSIRLSAERPFVPSYGDTRTLGVFLHRLALVPSPDVTELLLADLPAGAPELGSGWWPPELWGDGQQGRWTQATATLRIVRRRSESRLSLDLSGGHPDGHAWLRVDINGALVKLLQVRNAAATYAIDLLHVSGTVLDVRLIAERPFIPQLAEPESGDPRRLGVFVRAVRLEGASS